MNWQTIQDLLAVEGVNSQDERRRWLLNIILAGMLIAALVSMVIVFSVYGTSLEEENLGLFGANIAILVMVVGVYLVNRYVSGLGASVLFLVAFTLVLTFSDEPIEVIQGRSLFFLMIPVMMGSMLLRSYGSFFMAGVSTLAITALALANGLMPNYIAPLGFFMVALVSWLYARNLENALGNLEEINRNLDELVLERTRDLEQALQRERAEANKNQAMLTSIADGVVFFDQTGQAVVANNALAELIQMPKEEIVGQTLEAIMADDVPPKEQQALLAMATGTETIRVEWGEKTLSISKADVSIGEDQSIGYIIVMRDFTHEAELERLKDRFLSMTSHELRTPLNAMMGYTDMLQANIFGDLTEKQATTINRIGVNAKQMLGLVNNILDQARIEAGTLQVQIEPFQVATLMQEVKDILGVLATHRGLTLKTEIDEALPAHLNSDARRLKQILQNLVGNALKFTKDGSVTVRAYCLDDTRWAIDVIDTGVGISKESQKYIFDPFRQVDDPYTRETGGSGLGLSIVKQLVNLLGGTIHLESTLGDGSTFTVALPFQPDTGINHKDTNS